MSNDKYSVLNSTLGKLVEGQVLCAEEYIKHIILVEKQVMCAEEQIKDTLLVKWQCSVLNANLGY